MDLKTVRALKTEIAEQIIKPLITEIRAEHRIVRSTAIRRLTGAEGGIALGIAAGDGKNDYRLAVRVQRRALETNVHLRAQIEEAARNKADITYIGTVFKGGADAAPAALPWHQLRQRPLLIGASIGHFSITAGTLGGFAQHTESGKTVILSNNHVLANENKAKIGDAILQPGAYDGGKKNKDKVGELLAFVPVKSGMNNLVDAAIASIDADIGFDAVTLTGAGKLKGLRKTPLRPGDKVFKVGRTTGITQGTVTAIEVDDVVVSYEFGDIGFDSQIEIETSGSGPFSSGGDSGSVIMDEKGYACALLFAGSDQGGTNGKGVTFANDLSIVLEQLGLTMPV
ncbi:hypothetical protein [Phyllobacterium sp. OV277]|uniref:hypothetical protein n=1 Tax=Phyllobacterium sp. OV277 TaxID=1882772 RepID=UPI00087FE2CA|nr:hypothetical protein [Phyllobacterium sp. OV277]SDP86464.1 hypothetical protein SAMN05443582_1131 [Phyllobacterium sp. OV277]